jgi:hypothetical protein
LIPAKRVWDRKQPVLVTVPIGNYVAADRNGQGDVNKTADFLMQRFNTNLPGRSPHGGSAPSPEDRRVYQGDFAAWLRRRVPTAEQLWFSLDNEPDLWHETHPRIHPKPVSRQEVIQRSILFAGEIKKAAPQSLVFGPTVSGWLGMTRFSEQADPRAPEFLDEYLKSFFDHEHQTGQRLLDVLDIHWYPEHRGGGVRITEDNAEDAVADARCQAARSLYDPAFLENSWITRDVYKHPLRLLPRLRESIERSYPQTKLAISEYYFGGGGDVSGAIAQADALGSFALQQVFAAFLFSTGKSGDRYINAAFRLFRDYDGAGSGFGTTAVHSETNNPGKSAVYAALSNRGALTVVAINRSKDRLPVSLIINGFSGEKLRRFEITSAQARPVPVSNPGGVTVGIFQTELPARSVTMFEWSK